MPKNREKPGWGHPQLNAQQPDVDAMPPVINVRDKYGKHQFHYVLPFLDRPEDNWLYFQPDDIEYILDLLGYRDTDSSQNMEFCNRINWLARHSVFFIQNPPPSRQGMRQTLERLARKGNTFCENIDLAISFAQSDFEKVTSEIRRGYKKLSFIHHQTGHFMGQYPNAGITIQDEQGKCSYVIPGAAGLSFLKCLNASISDAHGTLMPVLNRLRNIFQPLESSGEIFLNHLEELDNRSFFCLQNAFYQSMDKAVCSQDFDVVQSLIYIKDKKLWDQLVKARNGEILIEGQYEDVSTILDFGDIVDEVSDIVASSQSGYIDIHSFQSIKNKVNTVAELAEYSASNLGNVEKETPQKHLDQCIKALEAEFNLWLEKLGVEPKPDGSYFRRYQSAPGRGYWGDLLEALKFCLDKISSVTHFSCGPRPVTRKEANKLEIKYFTFLASRLQAIAKKSK